MISMRPASGPKRSATAPKTAIRSPSWIISGWRSRDDAALGTEGRHVVLEHVDQLPVRPVTLSTQRVWTRGRSSMRTAARSESSRRPRGGRAGQAFLRLGQLLLQRRLNVDVREQLLDEAGRDLVADLVVGDHLGGGVRDRVRVEPLEADVAREQAHHREQGRQDDEHACNTCDPHEVFIADASAGGNHTIGMKWPAPPPPPPPPPPPRPPRG